VLTSQLGPRSLEAAQAESVIYRYTGPKTSRSTSSTPHLDGRAKR
jgi:hypothetical protein